MTKTLHICPFCKDYYNWRMMKIKQLVISAYSVLSKEKELIQYVESISKEYADYVKLEPTLSCELSLIEVKNNKPVFKLSLDCPDCNTHYTEDITVDILQKLTK